MNHIISLVGTVPRLTKFFFIFIRRTQPSGYIYGALKTYKTQKLVVEKLEVSFTSIHSFKTCQLFIFSFRVFDFYLYLQLFRLFVPSYIDNLGNSLLVEEVFGLIYAFKRI